MPARPCGLRGPPATGRPLHGYCDSLSVIGAGQYRHRFGPLVHSVSDTDQYETTSERKDHPHRDL